MTDELEELLARDALALHPGSELLGPGGQVGLLVSLLVGHPESLVPL